MWKLAEDTLSGADLDALADWLRTHPRLTQGEKIREFERRWSEWLGVRDSVMVTSGSTANFALVAAVHQRLGKRDLRVGVSSVTWSTNVTPSLFFGHELVLFDVDLRTLGVDESLVCSAMQAGEIDVLFVTHLVGFNALTERTVKVANETGVVLLEDCCESHGAKLSGRRVGGLGLAGTFSFYYGHHMTTVEGGMISTNDAELADHLRVLRAHGLARESADPGAYARQAPGIDPRFLFVRPGLNFRSTELNAFLGLRQLRTLDERIQLRNKNLELFLAGLPEEINSDFETEGASSFALPIIASSDAAAERVRAVVDNLGIESRPVVAGNIARQPFLSGASVRCVPNDLPNANQIHRLGMYVGNGHHVSAEMVKKLTSALRRSMSEDESCGPER